MSSDEIDARLDHLAAVKRTALDRRRQRHATALHGPPRPAGPVVTRQWSLKRLFGFLVLAAIGMALVHYMRRDDLLREELQRWKTVGAALDGYWLAHGRIPTPFEDVDGAAVGRSWREKIADHLDVGQTTLGVSELEARRVFHRTGETTVAVMAVVGPGTVFSQGVSAPNGIGSLKLSDAGVPNDAIIAVEVVGAKHAWNAAGDFDWRWIGDPQSPAQIGSPSSEGFHVLFADGEVWRLEPDTPREKLLPLMVVDEARDNSRAAVLGPYRR